MIPNFWIVVFVVVIGIFCAALVILEWIGRRDAKRLEEQRAQDSPWSLRSRRDQELDAITRGQDPRR